jgi:hypothetical protein
MPLESEELARSLSCGWDAFTVGSALVRLVIVIPVGLEYIIILRFTRRSLDQSHTTHYRAEKVFVKLLSILENGNAPCNIDDDLISPSDNSFLSRSI